MAPFFCCCWGVSFLKLNIRQKGTRITAGLLGNLEDLVRNGKENYRIICIHKYYVGSLTYLLRAQSMVMVPGAAECWHR